MGIGGLTGIRRLVVWWGLTNTVRLIVCRAAVTCHWRDTLINTNTAAIYAAPQRLCLSRAYLEVMCTLHVVHKRGEGCQREVGPREKNEQKGTY